MKLRLAFVAWVLACLIWSAASPQNIIGSGIYGDVKVGSAPSTGMITEILSQGSGSSPSNTAVNFGPLTLGVQASNWTGTSTSRQTAMPVAGTFSTLRANFTTIATGSWTLALDKNGSASLLSCTLSSGTLCQDNTDSVHVNAGDLVRWRITPTSTPTAQTNTPISVEFQADAATDGFIANPYQGANPSLTVFNYAGFVTGQTPSATEGNVSSVVPTAGTIDHLYCSIGVAPGTGKTWTITIMHNGVETSLQATVTAAATSCTPDLTAGHAFTVAAGDTISVEFCPGTEAVPGTCVATTNATANIAVSARWTPTTTGEAPFFYVASAFPTGNVNEFGDMTGTGGLSGSETGHQALVTAASTIKKLYFLQSTAPGAGASRAVTLRANAATPGTRPNCNTSGAGSGSGITFCQDTTNAYSASAGDLLDWMATGTGSPGTNTFAKFSAVVTVP